jgi:hypothetical protein
MEQSDPAAMEAAKPISDRRSIQPTSLDDTQMVVEQPLDENGSWRALYRLAHAKDRVVVAEIWVGPTAGVDQQRQAWLDRQLDPTTNDEAGKGVPARTVRALRPGAARREGGQVSYAAEQTPIAQIETDRWTPRKGDVRLAQTAKLYVEALQTGSKRPVADVQDQLAQEGHRYNATTIRTMLNRARKRGLLTPASKGRAGGDLTDEARKLLAKQV